MLLLFHVIGGRSIRLFGPAKLCSAFTLRHLVYKGKVDRIYFSVHLPFPPSCDVVCVCVCVSWSLLHKDCSYVLRNSAAVLILMSTLSVVSLLFRLVGCGLHSYREPSGVCWGGMHFLVSRFLSSGVGVLPGCVSIPCLRVVWRFLFPLVLRCGPLVCARLCWHPSHSFAPPTVPSRGSAVRHPRRLLRAFLPSTSILVVPL